jgi:hypothetical protein
VKEEEEEAKEGQDDEAEEGCEEVVKEKEAEEEDKVRGNGKLHDRTIGRPIDSDGWHQQTESAAAVPRCMGTGSVLES